MVALVREGRDWWRSRPPPSPTIPLLILSYLCAYLSYNSLTYLQFSDPYHFSLPTCEYIWSSIIRFSLSILLRIFSYVCLLILSSTYYLSLPLLISSLPILTHTYLKSLPTLTFKIIFTFLIICLSFFNFHLIPYLSTASHAYISYIETNQPLFSLLKLLKPDVCLLLCPIFGYPWPFVQEFIVQ